jgi:cell wall-associated NlpC family hydrolase
VQLCLAASGIAAPRDSDMQLALGRPLAAGDAEAGRLRRGDLVFWKGHVGFAADAATLVHVNAHHMAVVAEPMADAIRRIAAAGLAVLACRRLGPA